MINIGYMQQNKFSIKNRIRSFSYAFNGLKILLKEEHNARIHLIIAVLAIFMGFFFHISRMEWIAIIFAVGFVFALEIVNSSIEKLADRVSPDYSEQIKKVKDLSASAVLIAAISALGVGLLIFVPRLFALW